MEELRVARDYLRTEGERVRSINARYAHLTRALPRIQSKSLPKAWANGASPRSKQPISDFACAALQPPSSGHSFSLAAPHPCCRAWSTPQATAVPATALPASIPAQDLVGRWGLAAYHKEEDRSRTEAAVRGQCKQPYNISRGPRGGVIMHLPDQPQPTELSLKGGADGKNYIGPGEEPAGGVRDREIVTFDGRVLITRFIDPEVSGRYGASIYVRCGAETVPSAKKGGAKKASEKG